MKTLIPLVTLSAAMALVAGPAAAQNHSTDTNAAAAQQDPTMQQANAQEFFRASTLVGKKTQDNKGNSVGEIKEIAFNQQGQIFAFVDIGSGKWAAVPWQAINPATAKGSGNVTLNATQQQMKAGPAVTKDQWGSLNNPNFVQACYSYYHVQAPTATGAASTPGGTGQGQQTQGQQDQQQQHQQQEPGQNSSGKQQ